MGKGELWGGGVHAGCECVCQAKEECKMLVSKAGLLVLH